VLRGWQPASPGRIVASITLTGRLLFRIAGLFAALLLALGLPTPAGAPPPSCPFGVCTRTTTVWVPEFVNYSSGTPVGNIYKNQYTFFTRGTLVSSRFTQSSFSVPGNCFPNSVAIFHSYLYVVCGTYGAPAGAKDQIVVYDLPMLGSSSAPTPLAAIAYTNFGGLFGGVFDTHGHLWVSGFNGWLSRVPNPDPTSGTPAVDIQVPISLGTPVGITVDPIDRSFWVVGQLTDGGGFVANIADATLNAGQPTPTACLAADYGFPATPLPAPWASCTKNTTLYQYPIVNYPWMPPYSGNPSTASGSNQSTHPLFFWPEGVAVTGGRGKDGYVWVGNNGGATPAATIVRLAKTTADPLVYGGTVNKPFACPGGMFSGGPYGPLWVNDEGYDVSETLCGTWQNGSDQGSLIGRVLQFNLSPASTNSSIPAKYLPATTILNHHAPTPSDNSIGTSCPGFGGIFVQFQ
jgi:hypothetical protein